MNCAITGSSGVLGTYIIQNNPKVNFNCDKVKAKAIKKLKLSNTIFNK